MFEAVNIGCSSPWTLCLSIRRSIRRLRWASCWRILVFTRNPSLGVEDDKLVTYQTPKKAGDFENFPISSGQLPGRYAYSRTGGGLRRGQEVGLAWARR